MILIRHIFFLGVVLNIIFTTSGTIFGELHKFKPGELVSSDIINENFQRHEDSINGISSFEEILGSWSCLASTSYQYHNCGFPLDQDGFWASGINEELTFSTNSGKYFISPKNYTFPVYCNGTPKTISASVKGGILIFQRSDSTGNWTGSIKAVDSNHINIETRMGSDYVQIFICHKSDMPPVTPETLVAKITSNRTVSLNWTDASDDEDGFVVERASSDISGDMWDRSEFLAITSLSQNTTSFVDSNLSNGHIYWYRVFSVKNGVKSNGSNIESISIQ